MLGITITRERLLLYAAGGCLGLLLLDHFVLSPFIASWRERAETIHRLRSSLAQGAGLIDQEARWLRWRDDYRARLLPGTPADAENRLLNQVDGWARQAGLRLTSLRPHWKESGTGQPQTVLELQVGGNGSMSAVVGFVHSLETAPLTLAVEQLELAPGRQDQSALTLDLRISSLCQASAVRSAQP